jgi:hypothetical protein
MFLIIVCINNFLITPYFENYNLFIQKRKNFKNQRIHGIRKSISNIFNHSQSTKLNCVKCNKVMHNNIFN